MPQPSIESRAARKVERKLLFNGGLLDSVVRERKPNVTTRPKYPKKLAAVIHVGPHKTGSSTLQGFLFQNKEVLGRDNYVTPSTKDPKGLATLARCISGHQSCINAVEERNKLRNFVALSFQEEKNIVLSAEQFDSPHINLTFFHDVLDQHYKVHVVAVYRRFYDWLYSIHTQITEHTPRRGPYVHPRYDPERQYKSFVEWLTLEEMEQRIHMFTYDCVQRYKAVPGFNVSVINMHDLGLGLLEDFVCDYVPHAEKACSSIQTKGIELADSRNPGTNHEDIILLDIAAQAGWIELRSTKRSRIGEILRSIKKAVKQRRQDELPRICLSESIQNTLLEKSTWFEETLTPPAFQNSARGVQLLRNDFREKVAGKFCSLDREKLVKVEFWQQFFLGQQQ